ncbi:MAG: hypothetical protein AAF656_12745 [Planctomycetota bacterium]
MNRDPKRFRLLAIVAALGAGVLFANHTLAEDPAQAAPADEAQVDQDKVRERIRQGLRDRFGGADQASEDERPRGRREGRRLRDEMSRDWTRVQQAANDPATQQAALDFFAEHSPFRYGLYTTFSYGATDEQQVAVARLRQKMVMRYVRIDLAANRYGEETRSLAVQRLIAEDQVAEKTLALRGMDEGDRAEARAELEAAVKQLIVTGLAEREYRLQRLRDRLEREVASMERARSELDAQAAEQTERILGGELPPALEFDGPPPPRDQRRNRDTPEE